MNDVVAPAFRQAPPGARFVQLAEPFDGFERAGTCLLTPLLAAQLQRRWGLAPVVAAVSDTAGPKYGPNLKQVLMELQRGEEASTPPGERVPTAHTLDEVCSSASSEPMDAAPLLIMVDQRDVCPPLHALAPLRRTIQKRPGWSTVEKYVNARPETCGLLIASAFHPPYTNRMIEVAIGLGLPAAIVVRKGLEGSLTVSHKSTVELACCARLPDGTYERTEMKIEPPGPRIPEEERFRRPLTAAENAALLREYLRYGCCADSAYFTSLVRATLSAFDEALQWVLARVQPLEAAPSAPTTVESSGYRGTASGGCAAGAPWRADGPVLCSPTVLALPILRRRGDVVERRGRWRAAPLAHRHARDGGAPAPRAFSGSVGSAGAAAGRLAGVLPGAGRPRGALGCAPTADGGERAGHRLIVGAVGRDRAAAAVVRFLPDALVR
eukprot:ctg_227.g127